MIYLLIPALLLLGFWEFKRTGGFAKTPGTPGSATPTTTPALPGATPTPTPSPQQVVATEAPSLAREILDLLFNGRDPQSMDAAATELEKYGFFDASLLLHKRAAALLAGLNPSVVTTAPGTVSTPARTIASVSRETAFNTPSAAAPAPAPAPSPAGNASPGAALHQN